MIFIFFLFSLIQPTQIPGYYDILIVNAIVENQMETTFQEYDGIGVMFYSDSIAKRLYNHPQRIGDHYLLKDLEFIGMGFGLDKFAGILVHDYKRTESEANVKIEVWTLEPFEIKTYDVLLDSLNSGWKIREYVYKGSRPRKH